MDSKFHIPHDRRGQLRRKSDRERALGIAEEEPRHDGISNDAYWTGKNFKWFLGIVAVVLVVGGLVAYFLGQPKPAP